MFSDPIVVTLESVPTNLPRISTKELAATYKSADGRDSLSVSHQVGKTRTRTLVRLDRESNVSFRATGDTSAQKHSAYIVIDYPSQSTFSTDLEFVQNEVADLTSYLTANTNAVLVRLLGLET